MSSESIQKPEPMLTPTAARDPNVKCGNCVLGEPIVIPGEIRRFVKCRAGMACAVPQVQHGLDGKQRMAVLYTRPIWDAESEWCYLFSPHLNG